MAGVGAIPVSRTRLRCALFCLFFLLAFLLAVPMAAQRGALLNDPQPFEDNSTVYYTAPGTGVVIVTVFSERSSTHLDRQAVLKLVNLASESAVWQTTEDTSQAIFPNVPWGAYDAQVSAVGYLSVHQEIHVLNSLAPIKVDIVLHRDPAAVNLDVGDALLSPKARKEIKRAIAALKSAHLDEAQKHLDVAYKSAPSSPDLNFLLGYLYFQKKDFERAGTYLTAATTLNPRNVQALTLAGRAGLERQDYPAARSALEKAVLADEENWVPHNLLADAYLHEKSYDKARDQAQVAITKGSSHASAAELALGEALIGMGRDQEGVRALNTFLEQSPSHPLAGQVRNLIEKIQDNNLNAAQTNNHSEEATQITGVDPLAALPAPGLSLKSWQPPGIDDVKPAVAMGTACPAEKVIEESGKRVQELVGDVSRFAAVEDLFHQSLDSYGVPIRTETRKYNYVATISESKSGFLAVDEYRADKLTLDGYPDGIASTGFAALALVFHPDMRGDFEIKCEGLGEWHRQASWLVRFRQRDDRPNHMQSYKIGEQIRSVKLKGRAWITADKFQILRIEAEMEHPMPEIQLLSEHQVVEYGPVPFEKKNTTLWLPKSAEIYFDFRKHHYYRRHSFDHYMLFAVDSEEKPKEPQSKPVQTTEPASEKKS